MIIDPPQQRLNIDSTINANRHVPFVDRIINAGKYPVRKNPDGTVSTHLMASASDDKGPFVYPTLRLVNGNWVEDKNPGGALDAKDVIRFKTDSDADYFSRNYKTSKLSTVRTFDIGGGLDPRPKWWNDPNATKKFQDWVMGAYPGSLDNRGGVGVFGPKTTNAYNRFGSIYEGINKALTRPPGTSPGYKAPVPGVPGTPVNSALPAGTSDWLGAQGQGMPAPADGSGGIITGTANDPLGISTHAPDAINPGATTASEAKYNWMRDDNKMGIPGKQPGTPFDWKGVGDAVTKGATNLAPFVSNIVNAFRKPPMPKMGERLSYTPLQKVNLSGERYKVSSTARAADRATERNIDSNTAEAVKRFNLGQENSQISAINERENNMNVGISNEQAKMDANVSAANTGLVNKYRDELVGRQVAHQREQSANIANAADKVVMIRNERDKARVELEKARVLSEGLYGKSGVLDRARRRMKDAGLDDPLNNDYKDIKAMGGKLRKMKKVAY